METYSCNACYTESIDVDTSNDDEMFSEVFFTEESVHIGYIAYMVEDRIKVFDSISDIVNGQFKFLLCKNIDSTVYFDCLKEPKFIGCIVYQWVGEGTKI